MAGPPKYSGEELPAAPAELAADDTRSLENIEKEAILATLEATDT